MWQYDDYSGEIWNASEEKRQQPILTEKEARLADREYREEIFIRCLMIPYKYTSSFFSPPRSRDEMPTGKDFEAWLKKERHEIEKYRQMLEERKKGTG